MTASLTQKDLKDLASRLSAVAPGDVAIDKPLAPYTSYRIGGPTAIWVAPGSEDGVRGVLEAVRTTAAPLFVLGRGTNLLVSDRGWPGVTLYIGDNLSQLQFSGVQAEVGAGTLLMDVIRAAVERGLAGMEQMAGIPGGVGGALRMNAGAFGREIEAITAAVAGFTADGSPCRIERKDIAFGYRRAPQLEKIIITSARFHFQTESAALLRARIDDILALRKSKQPLEHPSCGSVFKRPPGYYAGALIEASGLKGERIGGAEISLKHAGFILNVADAAATDVYRLIRRIEKRVFDRFGIRLEREVHMVGDFNDGDLDDRL
ncbi:MAG: UDP-N-acetylmuramate dehydrogenase [Desulfobacterales bacterium]|jgi:UDP-N-acetylmuramate dehydrogenase|nr:UDP-N-acetylmuramate dehydrogenase [Desulfobacterales bacterium]